jgi:hypothetical protein
VTVCRGMKSQSGLGEQRSLGECNSLEPWKELFGTWIYKYMNRYIDANPI